MAKYTIETIIDAGVKTFARYGEEFTMSQVAEELHTSASTLYRHVATKRELYFAILTHEFDEFNVTIQQIIAELGDPTPQKILQQIGRYILTMAREDYEKFTLMFLTKPPDIGSKLSGEEYGPGPYELACDPQTIGSIYHIIGQVIDTNALDPNMQKNLTFYLISLIVGAGFVTSPTYEYSNQGLLPKEDYEQFHNFVIDHTFKPWLD